MRIEAWTDGSCWYKDRCGGWSFVIVVDGEMVFEGIGYESNTTSGRMELKAGLEAMKHLNENYKGRVHIVSDYAALVNAFQDRWWRRWVEMEWYGVKNSDIWKDIIDQFRFKGTKTKFLKVKGHSGVEFNERADFLAGEGRKFCKEKIKDMIQDVVFKLQKDFPQHDWDIKYEYKLDRYCILVNDYDFYMKNRKLRLIAKVLKRKYKDVKFFLAYKNFSHDKK